MFAYYVVSNLINSYNILLLSTFMLARLKNCIIYLARSSHIFIYFKPWMNNKVQGKYFKINDESTTNSFVYESLYFFYIVYSTHST